MHRVNSDFTFDDACTLRMKGAKDSSIVVNISRDTKVKVEEINVPELETAVNVCFIVSLGPLICIFVRTIYCRS